MSLKKHTFTDSTGYSFEYFQSDPKHDVAAHVFWFSAFTHGPLLGKILRTEQRFHGFKLANNIEDFGFTLIRDDSGLTSDGTYYYGEASNPFIERAVSEFLKQQKASLRVTNPNLHLIGAGSSMGAYGATKFGVMNQFDSVVALVPHFNLGAAREFCGRKRWIDWVCQDASELDRDRYLGRLQEVIEAAPAKLPRLFIQSAIDDLGVHTEQVLPFVKLWISKGGEADLDYRDSGGHSMVNAPNDYISAVLHLLAENKKYIPGQLTDFRPRLETKPERLERYFALLENMAARGLKRLGILP